MSKRNAGSQLKLDLTGKTRTNDGALKPASTSVVPFSDAATLQVRREAVQRITASGIFALPLRLRHDGK